MTKRLDPEDDLTQDILAYMQKAAPGAVRQRDLDVVYSYASKATIYRRLLQLMELGTIERIGPGTYRIVATHETAAPNIALVPFKDAAVVEPPVYKGGQWGDFYEQIIDEAALESIFADRRQSITQCVFAAQAKVLERVNRPELARGISGLSDLPADFMARFEAARTRQFDELTAPTAATTPPPSPPTPQPCSLTGAALEDILVELARRIARAIDPSAPQSSAPPVAAAAALANALDAPKREPLRVCIVGTIDSQVRHIKEDPEIAQWLRDKVLILFFENKDRNHLIIPPSCDAILCWNEKLSHTAYATIKQSISRDRLFHVNGISSIKSAISAALIQYRHAA